MAETDAELQLRVWKELAISKQILMRAATDALKLDPNCTQEELKAALEAALERSRQAEISVAKTQEQAKTTIAGLEKRLTESKRALDAAEARNAEGQTQRQKLEQQIVQMRESNAEAVNDLKGRLAEKEKELKAITTALSDTPQNVLKKLKTLQKQKADEAETRKQAEETANNLLKEKRKLEQTVKEMQTAQDKAAQLAARHRELHTLCGSLHEQLKPLVADAKGLPALPVLDNDLLESIEKAGATEEKKAGGAKPKR